MDDEALFYAARNLRATHTYPRHNVEAPLVQTGFKPTEHVNAIFGDKIIARSSYQEASRLTERVCIDGLQETLSTVDVRQTNGLDRL